MRVEAAYVRNFEAPKAAFVAHAAGDKDQTIEKRCEVIAIGKKTHRLREIGEFVELEPTVFTLGNLQQSQAHA